MGVFSTYNVPAMITQQNLWNMLKINTYLLSLVQKFGHVGSRIKCFMTTNTPPHTLRAFLILSKGKNRTLETLAIILLS
jgi:hypothetical protein